MAVTHRIIENRHMTQTYRALKLHCYWNPYISQSSKGFTFNRNQIIKVSRFLFFPCFSLSSYQKCGISASEESWKVSLPTTQQKAKRRQLGEREEGENYLLANIKKDQSSFRISSRIRITGTRTISLPLNAFSLQEHSFYRDQRTNLGNQLAR